MSLKLRIACAALLAATTLPAFALRLGEIEVKSSLNQPLVAAIPLHPKNLAELDGLSVGLASAADFARAGLALTPTDRTLRFHVTTDNNGQKLILVTSSQPVTDPYLDFLVQVNTRQGRQVREFVVLLNPVIQAPAPAVREAPVAGTASPQPAELPPASAFPQPTIAPSPQPAAAAPPPAAAARPQPLAAAATASGEVHVKAGDTLSGIALQATRGTGVSLAQMMLALQAANPDAFFKDNINDLKAGVILRMPARAEIDQLNVAAAAAEVHRQYEAWRASRPQPATILAGTAAEAAARAAPKTVSAVASTDHLTLSPPTGEGSGSHPGAAGGTATGTGSSGALQTAQDTLVSLNESNADLESRVRSLEQISTKTSKLLNLKDATVADLQHRLAEVHSGRERAAPARGGARASAAKTSAKVAGTPWYGKPAAWIVAALIVLAVLVLGLLWGRRGRAEPSVAHGPLSDPDDVAPKPGAPAAAAAMADAPGGASMPAVPDAPPTEADLALAPLEPASEPARAVVAEAPHEAGPIMPRAAAESQPAGAESAPLAGPVPAAEPAYVDDPVDTKLDLARAYLDMDDLESARAMLEEVVAEGSQVQKDEAKRLLADVAG